MLARFDTQGYRSQTSIQRKDDDAQHRFLLRASKAKRGLDPSAPALLARNACSRPSLALELRTFKSTFKRVVRHFVPNDAHALFQQSSSQADKRLRELGISTHTTAIKGVLDTSLDHLCMQPVEQALLKQRTATSAKKLKGMLETNARNNALKTAGEDHELEKIKVSLTQLDYKSPSRWMRKFRKDQISIENPDPPDPAASTGPSTRPLTCNQCRGQIDVKTKRLEAEGGFRILDCPHCRWRDRAQHLNCECGTKWYLCETHRVDPPAHQSKKPPKQKVTKRGKTEPTKYSNRRAPMIRGSDRSDRVRNRKPAKTNLHAHHPAAELDLSPELTETILANWKKEEACQAAGSLHQLGPFGTCWFGDL